MASNIDKEKAKKTAALVLENIRTEADLVLLEEYHRIFKKEVSFFRRSTTAAYLLMLCDQGESLRSVRRGEPGREDFSKTQKFFRKAGGDKRFMTADSGETQRRIPLAEEESKRLFFSVGRSRRVFPREILGLINTKTAISKEDIGAIRILDNYSFVQVRDTAAEPIIEALNGMNFRGRVLTVNYAKPRRDGEDNAVESESMGEAAADTDDTEAWQEGAYSDGYSDPYVDSEQSDNHAEEKDI